MDHASWSGARRAATEYGGICHLTVTVCKDV